MGPFLFLVFGFYINLLIKGVLFNMYADVKDKIINIVPNNIYDIMRCLPSKIFRGVILNILYVIFIKNA